MSLESFKRSLRLLEARFTPLTQTIRSSSHELRLLRSIWWNEADQAWFDLEIAPYFQVLDPSRTLLRIVDAGGSTGLFALAAAARFPGATIDVFEPSPRQCVMIKRNIAKNGFSTRIRVERFGLWNEPARLAFRTHGSISSLKKVTMLDPSLLFEETVEVMTLDAWAARERIDALDLIKMDIEGAEIEALKGAIETLRRFKPEILLQAYHLRDGIRTLERCVAFLDGLGYISREIEGVNGFIHARAS